MESTKRHGADRIAQLDECTLELEAEKRKNKELQASIHQFEIKLASEQSAWASDSHTPSTTKESVLSAERSVLLCC